MKKIYAFAAVALLAFSTISNATVMYGSIGNFDVINDTQTPTHGFDIEYEGLSSTTDVGYTWTYSRYGNPSIIDIPATATTAHKIVVRYTSQYSTATGWSNTTAAATFPWMVTGAHQCTNPASVDGCEHFVNGMFTRAISPEPTVTYHWLIEGSTPGTLVRADQPYNSFTPQPPAINIPVFQPVIVQPAPINNVVQPAVVNVVAIMPAPKEPANQQWGTPHWMKVLKTTTHNAGKVDAALLINEDKNGDGLADWQNGEHAQVESEWYLVQTPPAGNKKGGAKAGHVGAVEAIAANEKVTRKYEFYKYAGGALSFDGETHEAMCDAVAIDNVHGSQAAVGVTDVNGNGYNYDCTADALIGNYIGANMVGFEVAAPLTAIEIISDGQVGNPYVARSLVSGGNTPYVVTTDGMFPLGLVIDPATGILTGTPTEAGTFSFNVNATDADGAAITKAYTISIRDVNGNLVVTAPTISTQMLDNGTEGAVYYLQMTEVSGTSPFTWSSTVLPSGLSISADGVISGTPAIGTAGITTPTITVTDSKAKSASKTLTLSIIQPLTITATNTYNGQVGLEYLSATPLQLSITGGTAPYTVTTVGMPVGMSLDATNTFVGIPTTAGTYQVVATVTDSVGIKTNSTTTIIIDAAPLPPAACGGIGTIVNGNLQMYYAMGLDTGAIVAYSNATTWNKTHTMLTGSTTVTTFSGSASSATMTQAGNVVTYSGIMDANPGYACLPATINFYQAPICLLPNVLNAAGTACIVPVPVCVAPQVLDVASNSCITPACPVGQVRDATGICVVPPIVCAAPKVRDAATNTCITPVPVCVAPQVLDVASNSCITPVIPAGNCPTTGTNSTGKSKVVALTASSISMANGLVINYSSCATIEWNRALHAFKIGDKVEWQGHKNAGIITANIMTVN